MWGLKNGNEVDDDGSMFGRNQRNRGKGYPLRLLEAGKTGMLRSCRVALLLRRRFVKGDRRASGRQVRVVMVQQLGQHAREHVHRNQNDRNLS